MPIGVGEDPLNIPEVVSPVMRVVTGDILGTLNPASRVMQYHLLTNRRGHGLDPGSDSTPQ
ncbi:hypothetical protein [Streptomyces sp. NPDC097640]|uniref:hypothetical protein n=1 Tax=Streptomyces sp. NPDC097640 TaxID=3157229 RepID=UPI00331780D0